MEHLFADAVFQVRYYKGLLQKTELAASAAYRTWYIKTVYNEQTGSYEAKLDAAYLTGQSDPLFTDKKDRCSNSSGWNRGHNRIPATKGVYAAGTWTGGISK